MQNTYLRIFQLLGALGLLVGSVGLGIVVLRNALERRGELALVPVVQSSIADAPGSAAVPLIASLVVNGALWVWLASVLAVRGTLNEALRNE